MPVQPASCAPRPPGCRERAPAAATDKGAGYTAGPFWLWPRPPMDQFFQFLLNHYLLAGTFVALFIAFVFNEAARGGKTVSPQGLATLVNQQNARVIDVRDPAEFRSGHIAGSENIPYARLAEHLPQLKSEPDRPIVVVCNIGQTAGAAGQQLRAAGLTQVYRLSGGISGWKAQSLPLVRKK